MKKILRVFVVSITYCLFFAVSYAQKPQIGKWRDHLPHSSTIKTIAVTDTRVYAGGGGLFYYDREDGSLHRMTKTQGFSDFNVTNLAYYKKKDVLVITYENSNIDLFIDDIVYNISDLKRSDIYSAKNIHNISFNGNNAYLSCDFGIVVIDLDRKEYKEEYIIGENGSTVKVNNVAFNDSLVFAATDGGLYYADKNDPFLIDFRKWLHVTEDTIQDVINFGHKLIFIKEKENANSFLHFINDSTYKDFYEMSFVEKGEEGSLESQFIKMQVLNNKLFAISLYEVQVFNEELARVDSVVTKVPCWVNIHDGEIDADNSLWMAHQWDGLSFISDYRKEDPCYLIINAPTSPASEHSFKMTSTSDKMLLVPGALTRGLSPIHHRGNVFSFFSNTWTKLNDNKLLDTVRAFVDITVDPFDQNHYFIASAEHGVVEVKDNTAIELYNELNTDGAISPYEDGDYKTIRIVSVAFDREGNLWGLSTLQEDALIKRDKDGSWSSFETSSLVNGSLKGIIISENTNYKWFWGLENRIFVHDGISKFAYINPDYGNENFPSGRVNCLIEDRDGILWIGTDNGVRAIYHTGNILTNVLRPSQLDIECSLVISKGKIEDRPLLENVRVTDIAVDGANRKWIGTETAGVFLMSENMDEQILSFTAENSPLFSNNIIDIEINQSSGEVFFVTGNGVVSYMGEAIESKDEYSDVYVYPNPIRSDYNGPIAIKGLVENSLIHITDVSGNVVFTTQSLGGQAIWNGRNLSGNRVATGVYLVFAADKEGDKRVVTKLLFIK